MSVGYAFLLSNGATSPWHKARDLLDQPSYRRIWDEHSGFRVVAILRAREKPDRRSKQPFGYKIDILWIGDFSDRCAAAASLPCHAPYGAHDDEFPQAVS